MGLSEWIRILKSYVFLYFMKDQYFFGLLKKKSNTENIKPC